MYRFRNILFSPLSDRDNPAAARRIADLAARNQAKLTLFGAASMVKLHGGELHLGHAWELYGEQTMRHSAFLHTPAEELESLLHNEEASHRAALDELLSTAGLADETWQIHLHKGRPPPSCPRSSRSGASISW